jgi:hypothetical protein
VAIADRLGIGHVRDDPESSEMATDTNVEAIAKAVGDSLVLHGRSVRARGA